MKRYIKTSLIAWPFAIIVLEIENYIFNLKYMHTFIIASAGIASLIGTAIGIALRYAIHAARNHEA